MLSAVIIRFGSTELPPTVAALSPGATSMGLAAGNVTTGARGIVTAGTEVEGVVTNVVLEGIAAGTICGPATTGGTLNLRTISSTTGETVATS